jgi:hypothetical protein
VSALALLERAKAQFVVSALALLERAKAQFVVSALALLERAKALTTHDKNAVFKMDGVILNTAPI